MGLWSFLSILFFGNMSKMSHLREKTRFENAKWQLIVQIVVIITQICFYLLNEHICCHIMSRKSLFYGMKCIKEERYGKN